MQLLADYSQWILAVAGAASVLFVAAATFLELDGKRRLHPLSSVRVRFFRWWRHELTAAQVLLDIGYGYLLLPSTLYVFFHITILTRSSRSAQSMWYYVTGLTYIAVVTLWRTDAIMRAKARERRLAEEDKRASRDQAVPPEAERPTPLP